MANGSAAAYDDFGHLLGSKENVEGRIFIEPQGICVMAGLGMEDGHAQKALNSVEEHLATPHGIVLHQPAFTKYYLHLGEISSYPPGIQGKRGHFLPYQSVDHDRRNNARPRRQSLRLLPAHQSVGARRFERGTSL